jgi:hypothetical protein
MLAFTTLPFIEEHSEVKGINRNGKRQLEIVLIFSAYTVEH